MALKILIVDDDATHSTLFSSRLERRGFQVTHILDGSDLIKLIDKQQFDLVVLDVFLPGISGFELLKLVRQKYPLQDLPIIMLTSSDSPENIQEAFAYLKKHKANIRAFDAAVARINGQLSSVQLSRLQLEMAKIETMNAMITTYHHEINNPLSIAMATFERISTEKLSAIPEASVKRIQRAFKRILEVLEVMRTNQFQELKFDTYVEETRMINFKVKKRSSNE